MTSSCPEFACAPPHAGRVALLLAVTLPVALLPVAACDDPGHEPGRFQRDLLVLGPDAWHRESAPRAEEEHGSRDRGARVLRLAAGDSLEFRLEVAAAADLKIALSGAPGRLALDYGTFDPAAGQASPSEPMGSIPVLPGGSEERVPLPDPGGEVLVLGLSFQSNQEGAEVTLERLVVVEDGSEPPPIVFISVDTFTASHMSLYGYERETTPRLDEFAREAVTFDFAIANATWTTPSYVSQFSGLSPGATRTGPKDWEWAIPRARWTLAEMLRARGYRTAAFIDNLNVAPRSGLAQGFEVYDMSAAERTITDTEGGVDHIVPLALEWIDSLDAGPFFLFVQIVDLHAPYVAPEGYEEIFDIGDGLYDADATLPVEAPSGVAHPQVDGTVPQYVARYGERFQAGPGRMYTAPIVTAYDNQIAGLDASIGGFLEGLQERRLFEGAVILVSADHGETMLEHDVYFRHVHNFHENLQVPLIIRLPEGEGGGLRVSDPTQLIDLYPTLAGLAGLESEYRALQGRSLEPLLRGEAAEPIALLSESGVGNTDSVYWDGWKVVEGYPGRVAVERRLSHRRTRAWMEEQFPELDGVVIGAVGWEEAREKLEYPAAVLLAISEYATFQDPYHELFDLENDPLELNNLAQSEPEKLAEMLEVLERERARSRAARRTVPPDAEEAEQMSAEARAELEKLGYGGKD